MKFIWQRPRTFVVAAVAIAAAAAAVAIGGRPQVVTEPLLGAEWECSRTAFLVTSCSPSNERIKQRAGSVGASHANIIRPSS